MTKKWTYKDEVHWTRDEQRDMVGLAEELIDAAQVLLKASGEHGSVHDEMEDRRKDLAAGFATAYAEALKLVDEAHTRLKWSLRYTGLVD